MSTLPELFLMTYPFFKRLNSTSKINSSKSNDLYLPVWLEMNKIHLGQMFPWIRYRSSESFKVISQLGLLAPNWQVNFFIKKETPKLMVALCLYSIVLKLYTLHYASQLSYPLLI